MVVGMTIPGDGSCMGTGSVIFRRAAPDDLETIVALLADDPIGRGRENPGPQLDACYREAFAAIERDPNQLLVVAERGEQVIGVLQLSFIPGLTRRGMWARSDRGRARRDWRTRRRHRPGAARMGDRGVPQARLRAGPADLGQAPLSRARVLRGPWL